MESSWWWVECRKEWYWTKWFDEGESVRGSDEGLVGSEC
jgi:hypothetical protein